MKVDNFPGSKIINFDNLKSISEFWQLVGVLAAGATDTYLIAIQYHREFDILFDIFDNVVAISISTGRISVILMHWRSNVFQSRRRHAGPGSPTENNLTAEAETPWHGCWSW